MFESVCNVCNCVTSACSHTDSSVDTCTSFVIKNWQDGTMRRTCVNEPMMSSTYKHNGNSKVSIENVKPLIHRNTKCAAGVKASQIQSGHAKMCLMTYANIKDADQPAHPRSLISIFVLRCLDSMICIIALSKVSRF